MAHLAQTGQILMLKSRPGNVHDSRGAEGFLRQLITQLRERFGRGLKLEFRMEAAFFQEQLFKLLARKGCGYAIKASFNQWSGLKALVAGHKQWTAVTAQVGCFETRLKLKAWELESAVVVYRKRVHHKTAKNFQLDLFSPHDGDFEYSAVASNLGLTPRRCGLSALGAAPRKRLSPN